MNLDEYQAIALLSKEYPVETAVIYPALGLAGEAGETANKVKKILRGDKKPEEIRRLEIIEELGDCMWYIASLADDLDCKLSEIVEINVAKLKSRRAQGTIKGDGDKR